MSNDIFGKAFMRGFEEGLFKEPNAKFDPSLFGVSLDLKINSLATVCPLCPEKTRHDELIQHFKADHVKDYEEFEAWFIEKCSKLGSELNHWFKYRKSTVLKRKLDWLNKERS